MKDEITPQTLNEFIEKTPEIKGVVRKVGNEYIASGFSEEQILVLSCYIRLLRDGSWRAKYSGQDTERIYSYLGGNLNYYENTIQEAVSNGSIVEFENNEFNSNVGYYHTMNAPKLSGNRGYQTLQDILGKMGTENTRIIKAGRPYSSRIEFIEFLKELPQDHEMKLVDSYIDSTTFLPFAHLENKPQQIKIITMKVNTEKTAFQQSMSDFTKETGINIEIRISKSVHDRYLISKDEVWSLGTSINHMGNKDTIITQIDTVKQSLMDLFEERWTTAKPYN